VHRGAALFSGQRCGWWLVSYPIGPGTKITPARRPERGPRFPPVLTPALLRPFPLLTAADDPPLQQGRRAALVRLLRDRGITDERVLSAILAVPRHLFFDPALAGQAYQDKAFPIGAGQTISQPYTVAYQTSLLAAQPGERILEVGTGSGYQACVLLARGVNLHSIELEPTLFERAQKLLNRLGARATLHCGDGSIGLPAYAPYAGILVTAAAPHVPPALLRQLAVGGRLVVPVGPVGQAQRMLRIVRETSTHFQREELDDFRFVPLRGKGAEPEPKRG
jgi:protein-L-isoaspartate(D-aspartate) O-methyltransferase